MRDPLLQHATERVERRASAVQADGEIVALVAIPVRRRVARVECVEVDGANRRAILLQELAQAPEAARRCEELDRRLVRRHHRALFGHCDLLGPEQHLGGARLDRIGGSAENVTKHDLGELVDENGCNVDTLAKEREVRRLERRRRQQPLPEPKPHAVVRARVLVGDGRYLGGRHGRARRRDQLLVERELCRARFAESARARGAAATRAGNRR